MGNNNKNILWFVGGTVVGLGGCHLFRLFRKKHSRPLNVIEYVFFDHTGKPFTLTDREMYDIKHKYEDGVLVSSLAQDYGIDAAMICRIISCLKCL